MGSTTISQVITGLMSESQTTYEIFGDIIFSFLSYTYQANSNKYLNGILAQARLKEETSNAQVRWRIVDLV